ncbi:hypothetical protein GGR56DRAFT_661312 [Xylariaceae sp. FL0804]|nr:hypothetical protein GGR56DRAFT_661312 [Xylariaceae sp. FL0804]
MPCKEQIMQLNPLDHLPPANYSHFLLYMSLSYDTSPSRAFNILQEGLRRTFIQLPWLSGKVQPVSPEDPACLEVRYNPTYAMEDIPYHFKYNELGADVSYEELRELAFHPTIFADESLTWAPFLPDVKKGTEVFVAQANFVPGACIIASAMNHVVGDGLAVNAVFRVWGDNCDKSQQLGVPIESLPREISDHSLLDRVYAECGSGRSADKVSPDTWRLLGLSPPTKCDLAVKTKSSFNKGKTPKPELRACQFYISSANIAALRKDCQKELNDTDISFNDVVCAMIWRGLLQARLAARDGVDIGQLDGDARLDLPFDARVYFPRSIPPDYLGNFTMINQVLCTLSFLVAPSTSIAEVARAIRKSAGEVTPERVMDAYCLVKTRTGEERSLTLDNLRVDGDGLIITSFATFGTDQIGFGEATFGNGGRPDAIRSMMGAISSSFRYCAIMPRKSHGGIEFVATLSDEEMALLMRNTEFTKYSMFLS